jgi:hypothetical protein
MRGEKGHEQAGQKTYRHFSTRQAYAGRDARSPTRWLARQAKRPRRRPRAARGAHKAGGEDFGGIDYYGDSKAELAGRAKRMGVSGTSHMTKKQLSEAIEKKQ